MFSTITASGIIAQATTFVTELLPVLYIVVGFGVAIYALNWVARKFGRG